MYPPLTLRTDPDQLKPREASKLARTAGFDAGRWKGLAWPLCFVESEARAIELANDEAPQEGRRYYIESGESLTPVRFDTDFVPAYLKALGPNLSRDTIDDYIRFALAFTRGQGGRVVPVDQVDQLPLREELTLITRRKLGAAITPLVVTGPRSVTGCFLIGDTLFQAVAEVDAEGRITLTPKSVIADTLPVMDETFDA